MCFFLCLLLLTIMLMSFIHTHVAVFHSLSLLRRIPFYDFHTLFIHSTICGHYILELFRKMLLLNILQCTCICSPSAILLVDNAKYFFKMVVPSYMPTTL